MKALSLVRNALAVSGLFAVASGCYADSIAIASSGSETTNNSGSPTLSIVPDNVWATPFAGSSWVSYVNSGLPSSPTFVSPVNGTSVLFTDTFDITGTPTGGMVSVLADDTASVTLNGVLLMNFAPVVVNGKNLCASAAIGCLTSTAGSVNLGSALHSGVNTLTFDVIQVGGVAYGLDYSGTSNYSSSVVSAVPEPSTFVLISLPLLALLFGRKAYDVVCAQRHQS